MEASEAGSYDHNARPSAMIASLERFCQFAHSNSPSDYVMPEGG
jgi:hypothetical protein